MKNVTRLPMILKLTIAEVNHILDLLGVNEREGWYYGNREQYRKRAERIRDKLNNGFMGQADKPRPTCPHCHGRGKVRYYHGDEDTCPTCHGSGV